MAQVLRTTWLGWLSARPPPSGSCAHAVVAYDTEPMLRHGGSLWSTEPGVQQRCALVGGPPQGWNFSAPHWRKDDPVAALFRSARH